MSKKKDEKKVRQLGQKIVAVSAENFKEISPKAFIVELKENEFGQEADDNLWFSSVPLPFAKCEFDEEKKVLRLPKWMYDKIVRVLQEDLAED